MTVPFPPPIWWLGLKESQRFIIDFSPQHTDQILCNTSLGKCGRWKAILSGYSSRPQITEHPFDIPQYPLWILGFRFNGELVFDVGLSLIERSP